MNCFNSKTTTLNAEHATDSFDHNGEG